MGFLVFLTVLVFIAASAAGCFPDKQKTTQKLSAAACTMMAVTIILSLVIKEGMFSDFIALPQGVLLRAMLPLAGCAAAGIAAAIWLMCKK